MPAIKVHHTDTVDNAWDGPAMKTNLKLGETEAYYRKAFAWQDPEADATTKAAYKFIHHEVAADGTIGAANIEGCVSGCGVLNGGMGGTTIPEEDRQGVYDHLAAHIKDAGAEPPELKAAEMKELERRTLKMELRAEKRQETQQPVIVGSAAVYNQEAVIGGWFREVIRPGSFTELLGNNPDVVGSFNHDWNYVLGRTPDTLRLIDTPTSLNYEIDINPNDAEAMSVYAKVQRGDIKQSSMAFFVRSEEWTYPADGSTDLPLRAITGFAELLDVSPVTFPAFPQTSASVRSKAQAFLQKQQPPVPAAAPEGAQGDPAVLTLRQKARRSQLHLVEHSLFTGKE